VLNDQFTKFVKNWLPWQRLFGNRKKKSGLIKFMQMPSIWLKKIMKIGLVDAEILLVYLKKEQIIARKIYSPVSKPTERAKKLPILDF